jgi:GntR family transcriptional regulator, transcriptional repressor for pyruvate dehydrogenase complex
VKPEVTASRNREGVALPLPGGKVLDGGPTRAADKTLGVLRSFIFTGQLDAGQKLPPERLLADQLGTSRLTVRYALKVLEGFGFVECKGGRGCGWWVVDAALLLSLWKEWRESSNAEELRFMLEYSEVLETEIAFFAAQRRTSEDVHSLREILTEFERAGAARFHHLFHDALAQAAHNPCLAEGVQLVSHRLFRPSDQMIPGDLDEFHRGHERVLDAVADRDPLAAREAMRLHYRFSAYALGVDDQGATRAAGQKDQM